MEGKLLRTSWGWWQLQEEDCLKSALCWRIFSAFTLHPELNASLTAERPQCLRQVRPGSGRNKIRDQERKKIFFFFGIKIALSVEKKWKFHKSTHEKHQLYATSTDKYYILMFILSAHIYLIYM